VKAVRWWVQRVAAGEHAMVALIGPPGTSKTHLLACGVWQLYVEHRIRVPWFPWYALVDHLRYGRGGHTEHAGYIEASAAQVRAELHAHRHSVIDELAPTSGTDFDSIEIRKLVMNCYDREYSLLLSCNWGDIADMMGKAAADRFTQVTLDGPSYRGT
jgi:DNA replication protein DnaC